MDLVTRPQLALVNLPFAAAGRPSLALGLLSALAQRAGWEVARFDFNLDFGALIGVETYSALCGEGEAAFASEQLVGEALFAPLTRPQFAHYRRRILKSIDGAAQRQLLQVRAQVPGFIERCALQLAALPLRLVGLTSTFEQTQACVRLAQALRRLRPDLILALGGANCEAGMGVALARRYPCFDLVCLGEADAVWPRVLETIAAGGAWWEVAGFAARRGSQVIRNAPAPLVRALDANPAPDYSGYFATLDRQRTSYASLSRTVMLETSRGCWWGEHSHCTFCGLNAGTMQYRSKSPEVAARELRECVERYGAVSVQYADNILNFRGLERFLPALRALRAERGGWLEVFFETKSNLRRIQVRELAESGIREIQPGVESFDDEVLQRMGKGVRGLQNLALLKWARLYGVRPAWNLLYGFPGESRLAYVRMRAMVPKMVHLAPPSACASIRLDRFSPHFVRAGAFGLVDLRPAAAYTAVFQASAAQCAEWAYYFEFDYADGRDPQRYTRALRVAVARWQARHRGAPPMLHASWRAGGGLEIWDTRGEALRIHRLDLGEARAYAAFDAPRRIETVSREDGLDIGPLAQLCRRWKRQGLVLDQNGRWLALATLDDALMQRLDRPLTAPRSSAHTVSASSTGEVVVT